MKALRIFMMVALLAMPLFASNAWADFTADTVYTPFARVSASTVNQPIIGFTIPCAASADEDTLKTLALKSYMERAFSVELVKLWVETNGDSGWQATDTHLKTFNTSGIRFETQDTIVMGGINRVIRECNEGIASDTFYITVDCHTDSVNAHAYYFHEHGLEVVIEAGYIHLGLSSGQVNINRVNNSGYVGGVTPYFTAFKLIFDTQGPQFDLHFCIEVNTCSLKTYYGSGWSWLDNVDHDDSVRICATNVESDIKGDITIFGKVHLLGDVSSLHMFGVSNIKLESPAVDTGGCADACSSDYNTSFTIPNVNTSLYKGVDADSGHWAICAWAEDSAGNRDTVCLEHNDLPYRIDTKDPIIDEITWEFVNDLPPVGKINLGDCIMIVAKGYSNPIDPLKECVEMRVDTSWMVTYPPSPYPSDTQWAVLSDTLQENNRIFRRTFCLTSPVLIDSNGGCPVNFLVEAKDNACNWDTLRGEICADMDLDPPEVSVQYEWEVDYDTMWACLGLGDKALIRGNVTGDDVVSVTAMMDSAGIDALMQHAMSLTYKSPGVWDTVWTITEPPIIYGKDADNSTPPPVDADYSMTLIACDDGGNCVTATGTLNKTLDTRKPRPIGFACPDTVPCALHARSLAGGVIDLYWNQDCDENDAFYFYVWANDGSGWDSIGLTSVAEQTDPNYYFWHSEPLAEGYWTFKIKTEDNCSNVGDFSCEVGAYADATPPHVCIAEPDSGLIFGADFPLKAVADSVSHDVDSAWLWYRIRPDIENPTQDPGEWFRCNSLMDRPGDGYVFTDEVHCLESLVYTGWVEFTVGACDLAGNCLDSIMAYDDACVVDDDVFRPGHFLVYWDTLAPGVQVVSVNGFPSPQSACGFDVYRDSMNAVVITVDGATSADSFEVDVRALVDDPFNRIFHQDNCTMPCTVWVSVDGWDEGTRKLYFHVKDYDNGKTGDLQVELCVPAPLPDHCIYISSPVEWQRIPCTGTSGHNCVPINADVYDYAQCADVTFTEARFQWSPTGSDPWYTIADSIGSGPWTTCWDNTGLVEDGDTVYLRVIGHDEHYMVDTSNMVKVFVDCEAPNVKLRLEDVYYTCGNEIPKVNCDPLIVKAEVLDTLVDISDVELYIKRHSKPDIWAYWDKVNDLEPAWSDNIWMYEWVEPCCRPPLAPFGGGGPACMDPNDYWDIRLVVTDAAGLVMFDEDGDGNPDDSTFNSVVAFGAGITIFVDNEAPQPAISKVVDKDSLGQVVVEFVNPSSLLGGNDKAYVKAGDDITVEISVLPSEDTCEVYKVEYFLRIPWEGDSLIHVGTSFDPIHYPVTFNPSTQRLIEQYLLENGHWQGWIRAVLYDSLGNSKTDEITLYILDVTPSQAVIVEPENGAYVWGDVDLWVTALNLYEICEVCYEYRHEDSSVWYPVPNGCSTEQDSFPIVWHTLNTVPDGVYYLHAVATDCDNNVDGYPPTIRVTVANGLPTAVIEDPRICERTCPDDTVDTLGYIAGTVTLYATASSDVDVVKVEFWYKNIFTFPSDWTLIGTANFVSGGKYSEKWNTLSPLVADGRYHVKARAYNIAGRYGDSDPIVISVDNSAPFTQVVSIMGDPNPEGMDITKGDIIDIELWAMDSTSNEGWTRCYNSGVVGIQVCIGHCDVPDTSEITKCFEVSPAYDGFHTIQWNTSGLEFDGCSDCYEIYVKAWDCLGNVKISDKVTVNVSDIMAPITIIAGFDGNYIYGYSSEKVSTLLFEYADSGTANWIPIGWSSYVGAYCNYLYKTSWDPLVLDDGTYQIRVISHDECSNQDDDMAPIGYFTMSNGILTPYNPGVLEAMSFEKNWCTGDMQGIVRQTSTEGTPVVIGIYGSSYECVHMQAHLQNSTEYAGSFDADAISHGGSAKFLSSVTMAVSPPPMTGVDNVTYFHHGHFDIATVKTDLGTHGIYQEGCVELTIPDGAVDDDRYIWVAPTMMEWAPVTQPDILPIGDDNGYATYVSFTDCDYCCDWYTIHFGGDGTDAAGAGIANGDGDTCCFNSGKYAKIKMCYDSSIETPKDQLAVAWWDCDDSDCNNVSGEYMFDDIYYPATVEGFDTENHTVEFATTCLKGPFVVVQMLERHCDGTILVNMLQIEPYCLGVDDNYYTNTMPTFKALITDNVQGTDAIDQGSIQWKMDLFNPGELVRFYNGQPSDICDKWMPGFGSFQGSGYDEVSGIFRAGWNDSTYLTRDNVGWDCDGCQRAYVYPEYYNRCYPMYSLSAGDHMATVTAQNSNIQTCTDTLQFKVDDTEPEMQFADSVGAYVTGNPHLCIYFNDTESGVDKSSVWIDIYGDETNSPDPNNHSSIGTLSPDQLNWIDETTVCVDGTFEYSGGYLHVYVYGGPDCLCYECNHPQFYYYECGISDCVGNQIDVFWQYYTVDADGPTVSFVGDDYCDDLLQFQITDALSGLLSVCVFEDSSLVDSIKVDEHNPDFWWYDPSEGVERVDIQAKDNLGNVTVFSFDLPSDCAGPTVKFADGYVCKNPTITFWVTDPSGVDWSTVNVRIAGCGEECIYYAPDLTDYIDTETGKVTIDGCHLDCGDANEVEVYVFSGTSYTGNGPKDLDGNYDKYRKCSYVVDYKVPSISVGDTEERPIEITISDARSGVDWSTLEFYEDGALMCSGTDCTEEPYNLNTETGKMMYEPESGGVEVEIRVNDMTGCNLATKTFEVGYTADEVLAFGAFAHNEPNPFDPGVDGPTYIDPQLTKRAYVTVKIYDFAGEFVKEVEPGKWINPNSPDLWWDGKTDGGTEVANGTYLCYIHARDEAGSTKTAVIKITVLKDDK